MIPGAKDKSWKVRLALGKSYAKIMAAFGKDVIDSVLVPTFKDLITDSEPEV